MSLLAQVLNIITSSDSRMLPLNVPLEVQHPGVTVRTLLLGSVTVGLQVEREGGLQHVFFAERTECLIIIATNLQMRDNVVFSHHLPAYFTRNNKNVMVGMFKMILDVDGINFLLADGTLCPEENLGLTLETF